MAIGMEMDYGVNLTLPNRGMICARRLEPGVEIVCVNGRLWVTFDRDREDHLLLAGDRYLPARRAHGAVIYAIGPSELNLLRPERVSLGALIARVFRRRFALRP